ncbi:MAG TPA: hypothetical protein VF695_12720 [Sphingomonas sp.]
MVRDGLHAKVFVSSAGAIICSANASANGVGRTRGEAGNLVEAGIVCPTGSPGLDGAAAFFDTQFGARHPVSRTDLERAADWSNEPALPASATALKSLTLIERLQHIGKANGRSFRNKVGHPDLSKKLSEDEWSSIGRLLENDDWLFTPQQFAVALQSDLGTG